MSTTSIHPVASPDTHIPPLRHGDRLTHAEFMERYEAMPPQVKAERIEGIVYMAPPAVSAGFHGRPHIQMATWLGTYEAATSGVAAADNSTTSLDTDNDPQPDLCLYVLPENQGRVKMDAEGYILGSPELIVEIAGSSVGIDLGKKFNVYKRNDVHEYIVYRSYDAEIDWFILRGGEYVKLTPDARGVTRSETFPGLWLQTDALALGRLADVLATLQTGLASPEHGDFVAQLARGASHA